MHIENLYKAPEVLECYALEKIHGTSTHITYKNGQINLSPGPVSLAVFSALFDVPSLRQRFAEAFTEAQALTIFGEAFGGKVMGMSGTYGTELRFLAFDVRIDDMWLDVPSAAGLCEGAGIGFVPYERGPLALAWLDGQRDRDSLVAPGHIREGIVVRPIHELIYKTGERFIFKHKRAEFSETKTPREVDPARVELLIDAKSAAEEWVTAMRLEHVLQRTPYTSRRDTGDVIRAMQEDVKREAGGEIEWSIEVDRAVGKATAQLLRAREE